jgi:nucleoid-associated protein YgaU
MRKDVKIGLAIAGVLFAVLIVYAFVPKKDTTQTAGTGDTGQQQTEGDTSAADNSATPAPADGGAAPADASAPRDGGVAGKGADNVFDPNYKGAADATGATAKAGDISGGNTDWFKTFDQDKIVSVESHPPLIATKTPAPGSATPAPAGTTKDQAVTDVNHGPGGTPIVPAVGDTGGPRSDAGRHNGAKPETTTTPGKERSAKVGPEQAAIDPPSKGSGGGRTHVIKKDETFSTIARMVYGNQKYFAAIQKANPDVNPNRLKPGTTIVLPDVAGAEAASASSSSAAKPDELAKAGSRAEKSSKSDRPIDPSTQYRVQPGDSLYKISVKLYGNGSHAEELYDNNSAAIGPDKGRLKVGMVLKLHDAPRVKQAAR